MKLRRFNTVLFIMAAFVLFPTAAFSENTEKDTEEDQLTGSYLDIYHAKETSTRLRDENRLQLYRLKIMVANFGDGDEKSKLDAANENYKEAVKSMYKKHYLVSEKKLTANHSEIESIYGTLAKKYREKTTELLNRTADRLVKIELSESVEPGASANTRAKLISRARISLVVGYNQLTMGEAEESIHRFAEGIAHYRVARFHAIHMLAAMAETEEDRKKILDEFKVDLMDIENKTAEKES